MGMANRIRMNSTSLQKAFPDVYKEFFAKCSTVVSAPGSFFWSAGLAVIYGGTGILQKLPLRVYVGIEHDSHKTLRYGDYFSYVPHQQQFEYFNHDQVYETKFLKLLNELRSSLPKTISGKIHILSEVPRGAGLNQSGAVNMSISVLLGLESGLATPAKIMELTRMKTPEIQSDQIFNRLFRFAWKLEANAHVDLGSGSAPFATFLESTSPIMFFSERRQGGFNSHPYSRFPSDVEGHYEIFDAIEYGGYRLKDLYGWRSDLSWPIDYGLLYLGQQKHSSIYLKPMRVVKAGLDHLESFIHENLHTFPSGTDAVTPATDAITQKNHQHGYWEHSVDFLLILSAKAVWDLKALIENGTAESLDELCDTVQLQEKIYEFFTKGLPSSGERDVLARVKHVIREKSSNGLRSIRLLPDRPDGGGDLLFIAPQGYLQDNLEQFQTLLRTHVSPLVRLDYLSWSDGDETGGIRIDQDFANKNYSPFISRGTVSVVEWEKDKTPTQHVYSVEAFEKAKQKTDLLLHPAEHKIFIQGTLLNSKQIKSAKGTIEILKILLEHLGEDISAGQLPASAYVERNEMQSKIISPLCTAFKDITGKKLPLGLQGGLRKNFTIKLGVPEFTIGLVEKQM